MLTIFLTTFLRITDPRIFLQITLVIKYLVYSNSTSFNNIVLTIFAQIIFVLAMMVLTLFVVAIFVITIFFLTTFVLKTFF
jgi:hypothetical protein